MRHETVKSILEMEDEDINAAVFPPESSRKARRIYDFIVANSNLTTMVSGMSIAVTGMDRAKLMTVANGMGIDLGRYMNLIDLYEQEMLKEQESKN